MKKLKDHRNRSSSNSGKTEGAHSFMGVFLKNVPALRRAISNILLQNQDTDDLLQEAFLRGMNANQEREIKSIEDYLFIVTRNLALKERAKQQDNLADALGELALDDIECQVPGPEENLYSRNRFNAFIQSANTLPEQCQRAFLLKHIEGCSQKEIAKIMGIAESTVEKHLSKGLRRCAAELEQLDYLTPTKKRA